ncbi:hypothetical protein [Candidatus Thiodictyon syntrophicum]|jgi:hypothetical protein|uniref:HEPN domain-containing protein n=1 Tax=Candidatus Thiodictyon syntrophicum TaxID=1166950 RepID=A0A2K8UIA1_9GAMM|nr:hypothetical protein [Candidatus Thiodictyon syntrophicum]AUB85252.1 hypothetical protein THSYN_30570 [Candidatus Thiodictyon syntrophicum]
MAAVIKQVDFKEAARRHWADAEHLANAGRHPNAGQLYGFMAECGLKALLVAHGLPIETNGDIKKKPKTGYREHMPDLSQLVSGLTIFPDGRAATRYLSMLPDLAHFHDWSTDHRYWAASAYPASSLPNWREAARQVGDMIDAATADGVM